MKRLRFIGSAAARLTLAAAFGLVLLPDSAFAQLVENTISSVAALRGANWGTSDALHVLSYYAGQNQGGGTFARLSASCTHSVNGDVTSGSQAISNLSGPVYVGEQITASAFTAGTTISGISFNRVLSAGTWTSGSTTISHVPDTTNIQIGMTVNSVRIANGTTVSAVTAPSTVVNTTGTLNNGFTITNIPSTASISVGMFVTMTLNNDSVPKILPDSAFVPGLITVASKTSTTVTLSGSEGIAGIATSVSLRFTSTDGSVTISAATTGAETNEVAVVFYQKNGTASSSSSSTASQTSLSMNGDNGGMQIVDGAGHCFARQSAYADVLGWGAIPDGSSDSTGPLQNAITWAGQSTQPGPASSLNFPALTGVVKASNLIVLKPVPFIGQGWNPAILQQTDGQTLPLVYTFPLLDQSNRNPTYMSPQYGFQNITLRAPNDVANTIGLYLDGYNSNVNIPDVPKAILYANNFMIDSFKNFGLYNARMSGTIVSGAGRVQINGVGVGNTPQDCLHSDGGLTWVIEDLVVDACDYGLYLQSPLSWTLFRTVDFTNNHGAMITGSLQGDKNNGVINFYDFQYGNNNLNNFIIDVQSMRVNCIACWVQDTGTFAGMPGVYSDIEITANANINRGPILQLTGNYFTQDHSEQSAFQHLHNITFDSGATASVGVDASTTTSSTTNALSTNLVGCSCTSRLLGELPVANSLLSYTNNITAHGGGGQASAVAITTDIAIIAHVVTIGDSVQLPLAAPGMCVTVSNTTSRAAQVFAQNGSTDTLNGVAGSTGVSLASLATTRYCSGVAGAWVF